VENAWQATIDRETFRPIQRNMAARRLKVIDPGRVSSTFLLSGLLFCSCGRAMTACSAKSGKHLYYVCSKSAKRGRDACDAGMLPRERLESLVARQLQGRVLTQENLELLVRMVNVELQTVASRLGDRLEIIDADYRDLKWS